MYNMRSKNDIIILVFYFLLLKLIFNIDNHCEFTNNY